MLQLLFKIVIVFLAGAFCGVNIGIKIGSENCNNTCCKPPKICFLPPVRNPDPKDVDLYKTLTGNPGHIYSVAISSQDPILVSGSNKSKITLWDVNTEQTLGTLEQKPGGIVESLAISLDGQTIASGGSTSDSIYIWDLPGRYLHSTITEQALNLTSLALSRNANYLASGSSQGKIKIWNLATSTLKYDPLPGHSEKVTSLAIGPNGKILASGSENGEIKIWNLDTGGLKYDRLPKHSSRVTSLAINSDGNLLASGSSDGTVKLWYLRTGRLLETYKLSGHAQETITLTISQDDKIFLSGHSFQSIKLWLVP